MSEITDVTAWEVLDSRGHPTVRCEVTTLGGSGRFTVPSGASTGRSEAVERRDGGDRYGGLGVTGVVSDVEGPLAEVVTGRDVTDQVGIDRALERADGTDRLLDMGANAVLAVSGAALHAAAVVDESPLYRYVAERWGFEPSMPTPMVNVVSGGLHAEGGIEVQDFLVVPVRAESYADAVETAWDVRDAVRSLIREAGHRPLVADEGGFAPPMHAVSEAFDLLVDGIERAGYHPGSEVSIAVDVAASHFYDADAGIYRLESVDRSLDRDGMISLVADWTESYPVVSIEDPLAEDDWEGWARLADRIDGDVQLLGDDLVVTDPDRLSRAMTRDLATAVLVKPNQAGTITRATNVVADASEDGTEPVVSARSGETCDATIADLAVGLDAGQIKIGSLARSERLAKYNRLLEIERASDPELKNPLAPP